jgi:2-dehydropantoate 2-reductase
MKIAVFGIGGVGGYFGGKLTQTEHEIIFIARGEHLEAIRANGLEIEGDQTEFIVHPTLATDNPSDVGEVDVIILATKAWHVPIAAEQMKPMIGEDTIVVPLLNGVEAPIQLSKALGGYHVLGGFCRVMSHKPEAGRIVQGGIKPTIAFGEQDGTQSERVQSLRDVFESAGVEIQATDHIISAMWDKLLFISAFGGVGSVTRQPAGILRSFPEARNMLIQAMQEVKAVAEAHNIPMNTDAVEKGLAIMETVPKDGTASMQRDIMNGLPSELEAQNGAVVRLGKEVNTPTPINEFIYHALLPSEKIARGEL